MTKKNTILAFFIIGITGTLLHFVYEWSGENKFVAIFSAVNESVWEHQKLLFFPAAIYFLIEYFISGREFKNYFAASAIGIISGILTIIILFYTYSGILGFSVPVVDILLFFVGVAVMLVVRNIIIKNNILSFDSSNSIGLIFIILLAFIFGLWTFFPPKISLFIPNLA